MMILGSLFLASAGRESNGDTIQLTVSNMLTAGPNFVTVTLTQIGPGVVEFKVTPNDLTLVSPPVYKSIGNHFGIVSFEFNTQNGINLSLADFTFKAPSTGWRADPNGNLGAYGTFDWIVTPPPPGNGVSPLLFDVSHQGITTSSFEVIKSHNAEFSAKVANFTTASGVTNEVVSTAGAFRILFVDLPLPMRIAIIGLIPLVCLIVAWILLRKRGKVAKAVP